jgi:hypothetical protein
MQAEALISRHRAGFVVGLALLAAASLPAVAAAANEGVRIREVFPGSVANPTEEWIELQFEGSGEGQLAGRHLTFYDQSGFEVDEIPLADVADAASQATVLVASSNSSLEADVSFAPNANFGGGGGGVCLETTDCVVWGTASTLIPSTPSPFGTPAAAIPDGSSLIRTIARGCPNLLDSPDDTDDSAADFVAGTPAPRPNSSVPLATPCRDEPEAPPDGEPTPPTPPAPIPPSDSGSPSGGASPSAPAPPTSSAAKPPRTVIEGFRDKGRTATFRFSGNGGEGELTFRCRLDGGKFSACVSPRTYQGIAAGKHLFAVEARDAAGHLDTSPAKRRFTAPAIGSRR